jgi:tRNA pseudouridine55 synthase
MIDPKVAAESGALLVDKAPEWTSHDVVNLVRRRFGFRKVGHCGTLDPGATGLLVVVLERATKLSAQLMGGDKLYEGTLRLGVETFSQDSDGEVTATHELGPLTAEDVCAAAAGFVGDIQQIPPMVSAVKQNGQPLYKRARRGQVVEREPRSVTVHAFEILRVELPDVSFRVKCSKGTYVRTLAADLGTRLGCGAHLCGLRRLASGPFQVEDAVPVAELKSWDDRERVLSAMIPMQELLDLVM